MATRSRVLEASLALGAFAIAVTEFASMSLLPQFTTALGVSVPTGGRAVSAYALGVVVGAPVLAVVGARWPRRQFLVAMMALFAAANVGSAAAPSFAAFVLLRFLSGVPHGAYFGVACLLAASLVPPTERARATARVMLGFTVGTIVGVPLISVLGRTASWRWAFVLVGLFAMVTAALVWSFAPRAQAEASANWRREVGALGRRQVWLTLGIGAIGQGGLFSIFSYLSSALDHAAHAGPAALPLALSLFGIGMGLGVITTGSLADRLGAMNAIGLCLGWAILAMCLYALSMGHTAAMLVAVTLVGCSTGLATAVQTRLMDVAGDAQVMAAALNHAAFNVANAIGPAAGGAALAAGLGWAATGWVGAALATCGLGVAFVARLDQRS